MQNQQIYQEACELFLRLRDVDDDPSGRNELMEWLCRSPEHVSAYLEIAAIWMEVRNVKVDADLDLASRLAAARADHGVTELTPRLQAADRRRLPAGPIAIAASTLVVLVAGLLAAWWQLERTTYSTALGEQRSISLRDGSRIDLNSQSRVRVHLDESVRKIELLRGQVLFHVAKDPSRPFVVYTDDTAVRAVGTVFDVYRRPESAVVTVVEGTVVVERELPAGSTRNPDPDAELVARVPAPRVSSPTGQRAARHIKPQPVRLRLTAGKQVIIGPEIAAEPRPVNLSAVIAWTKRQLIFESIPLVEVVDEFNRYNERRLIAQGEQLRSLRISAVFRSTDPGSLVRYLQTMPDVRIQETEDAIVIMPIRR